MPFTDSTTSNISPSAPVTTGPLEGIPEEAPQEEHGHVSHLQRQNLPQPFTSTSNVSLASDHGTRSRTWPSSEPLKNSPSSARPGLEKHLVFKLASELEPIDEETIDHLSAPVKEKAASMDDPFEKGKLLTAFTAGLGMLAQNSPDASDAERCLLADTITTFNDEMIKPHMEDFEKTLGSDILMRSGYAAVQGYQDFGNRCAHRMLRLQTAQAGSYDDIVALFEKVRDRVGSIESFKLGRHVADVLIQIVMIPNFAGTGAEAGLAHADQIGKIYGLFKQLVTQLGPFQRKDALICFHAFNELKLKEMFSQDEDFCTALCNSPVFKEIDKHINGLMASLPKKAMEAVRARLIKLVNQDGIAFEDPSVELPR